MEEKDKNIRRFIIEVFSENGTGSSKRIIGSFGYIIATGCVIYLTVKYGAVSIVENLITTLIIVSASLLGLSNITSIWKQDTKEFINNNENRNKNDDNNGTSV